MTDDAPDAADVFQVLMSLSFLRLITRQSTTIKKVQRIIEAFYYMRAVYNNNNSFWFRSSVSISIASASIERHTDGQSRMRVKMQIWKMMNDTLRRDRDRRRSTQSRGSPIEREGNRGRSEALRRSRIRRRRVNRRR